MAAAWGCSAGWKATIAMVAIAWCMATPQARAAGPNEVPLDANALTQMEQQADKANPRDQCYMYAELVHGWTELAGRQMAAGDDEAAGKTVSHIDAVVAKMQQVAAKNAKRLKNAEELMEHTSHRLADMVRVASGDERATMQAALRKLDHAHTAVLALVFAQ